MARSSEDALAAYREDGYNVFVGCVVNQYTIRFGDNAVVTNSQLVAGIVQRSFNQAQQTSNEQLKADLTALHAVVTQLCERLPADQQKGDAAEALELLTKEVTRTAPREPWYRVSAQGLMDAAKSVADVGPKVVKLVKEIGASFGFAI